MASLVAQQIFSSWRNFPIRSSPFAVSTRNTSQTPKKKPVRGTIKNRHLIESDAQSLADRGFLRFYKPYSPPPNATDKFYAIVRQILGPNVKLEDEIPTNDKFVLLHKFWKEFDYGIPNSQLHKICVLEDLLKFYTSPVVTKSPYDQLQEKDLPPNLHVQPDYVRFDPETDTRFGGISAYPHSPTIVTGLKAKKKYKSTHSRLPYYYYNEAVYLKESSSYLENK